MSPDGELANLARSGDPAALGLLLALHRADMHAVALSVLKRPDDAEDAVQDAIVTALRRIGDLRDPAAAGAWLRMIVRNVCRMRLRRTIEIPSSHLPDLLRGVGDPQDELDQHALRDWVGAAVERLPMPLRTVTLARYFSSSNHYAEIAALCGIPLGTVRSRLSEARRRLADELLATRYGADGSAAESTATRWQEAEQAVAAGHAGTFGDWLRDGWRPDLDVTWADGRQVRGIDSVAATMDRSMAAGVRQRVVSVAGSIGVTIWELEVINPPGIEQACPSYATWLMTYAAGRVDRLRLFHRAA